MSKRVLSLVQLTVEAPKSLKFYPRVLYSALMRCKGRRSSIRRLSQFTGVSRDALARAREVLISNGLASKQDGRIIASRPSGEQVAWFYYLKNPIWWESFQYIRFHAPSISSPLDHRGLAVLGFLSFRAGKSKEATNLTYSYIAVKTGVDYRSVAKYMVALAEAGFIIHQRKGDREFFSVPIVDRNAKPDWFLDREKDGTPRKAVGSGKTRVLKNVESDTISQVENKQMMGGNSDDNSSAGWVGDQGELRRDVYRIPEDAAKLRRVLCNISRYALDERWVDKFCGSQGDVFMPSLSEWERLIDRAFDQAHLLELVKDHYFNTQANWIKE